MCSLLIVVFLLFIVVFCFLCYFLLFYVCVSHFVFQSSELVVVHWLYQVLLKMVGRAILNTLYNISCSHKRNSIWNLKVMPCAAFKMRVEWGFRLNIRSHNYCRKPWGTWTEIREKIKGLLHNRHDGKVQVLNLGWRSNSAKNTH